MAKDGHVARGATRQKSRRNPVRARQASGERIRLTERVTQEFKEKTEKRMMHLGLVTFTTLLLVTAANPLGQDMASTSNGPIWGLFHHTVNQAADKTGPTNNINWMGKGMGDNKWDPQEAEEERKRILERERLRARLQQELAELRERLHPYADTPAHLGTLNHQLQETLRSRTQELCSRLHNYVQEPESSLNLASSKEAMQWISQTVESAKQEMFSHLEEVQTQMLIGLGPTQADRSHQLGQEFDAFRAGLQNRVAMLLHKLSELLGRGGDISSSVHQFCQSVILHIQEFRTHLERHLENMEQNQGASLQTSSDFPSLGKDFSNKLNSLLQDILENLHWPDPTLNQGI
ncbi:hypothetical protein GN956_G7994 [Arapaima gigas]